MSIQQRVRTVPKCKFGGNVRTFTISGENDLFAGDREKAQRILANLYVAA